MKDILRYLHHPDQAAILARFPDKGLALDPIAIRDAIRRQLDGRNISFSRALKEYGPERHLVAGLSRVFRSLSEPQVILTSYNPEGDQPRPGDREAYRAMSLHPSLSGFSSDFAEGLWITGTNPDYSVLVQAFEPYRPDSPRRTMSRSYEYSGGVMPTNEYNGLKLAAMRSMHRLGLI